MKDEKPTEELDLKAKLEKEANEYFKLSKDKRSNYSVNEEDYYIINRKWLAKWKLYADYKNIKDNSRNYYHSYSYNRREYQIDKSNFPDKINNDYLLVPFEEFLNDGNLENPMNYVIRHDVDQRKDVKIINKKIWDLFYENYGGGPKIVKNQINDRSRSYSSHKIVELFYRKFQIITLPPRKQFGEDNLSQIKIETVYISRTKTLNDLKEHILSLKSQKNFYKANDRIANLRLWKFNDNSESAWKSTIEEFIKNSKDFVDSQDVLKYDKISSLEDVENSPLDDLDFADNDICLIEYSDNSQSWLFEYVKKYYKNGKCEYCSSIKLLKYNCSCNEVAYCSPRCLTSDKDYHKRRCKRIQEEEENEISCFNSESCKGLCGLQNLGNTCFMNSSLQCISNCYELTEYFLKDYFKKDVNKDNPLGSGGDLCTAYANLLKNLWYGRSRPFSPWNFKRSISGFQQMFSGYQQHDTQEFLNYLLDGLHEDLNRVTKKPVVEKDESSRPDEEKSKDAWIGFLRRNQSILVDLFYGLFKSTLYCPECEKISTCFDPFLSVSLPMAAKTESYEVLCNFFFYDFSAKPLQLSLQFSSETTLLGLRNKVAKILKIHPFSFLIVNYDKSNNSGYSTSSLSSNVSSSNIYSSIDYFLNSHNLLKPDNSFYSSNENKKVYFLIQIDPRVFYSNAANAHFKKLSIKDIKSEYNLSSFGNIKAELLSNKSELAHLFSSQYDEDESGVTSESISYYSKRMGRENNFYTIHTDENHGFSNDYIPVIIHFSKYDTNYNNITQISQRTRILSPRVIYLCKKWSLNFVHFYIFEYLQPLLDLLENNAEGLDSSEKKDKPHKSGSFFVIPEDASVNDLIENNEKKLQELYQKYFSSLNTDLDNDTIQYQKEKGYPYRLRLKRTSFETSRFSRDHDICTYCKKNNCWDCLLPSNGENTIADVLDLIPKSTFNDREIDNSYYYLNDKYRNFITLNNMDFAFEVSFLENFAAPIMESANTQNISHKQDFGKLQIINKQSSYNYIDFKTHKESNDRLLNVIDCFKNFVKLEKLEANNEWFCPDCKKHVRATKKMEIYNSPNILIVHLKRFKNNSKIDTLVDFPLDNLDITDFVINKNSQERIQYELFAVANHLGSMGFGHYTAYCKNKFTGFWYDFDDSNVSRKHPNEIVSKSAYVLFYKRKNLDNKINLESQYTKCFQNFEGLALTNNNKDLTLNGNNTKELNNIGQTGKMEIENEPETEEHKLTSAQNSNIFEESKLKN